MRCSCVTFWDGMCKVRVVNDVVAFPFIEYRSIDGERCASVPGLDIAAKGSDATTNLSKAIQAKFETIQDLALALGAPIRSGNYVDLQSKESGANC